MAVSGAGRLVRGDAAPVPLTAGARIADGETVWAQGEPLAVALRSLKVKLAAGSGASFRGRAAGRLDIGLVRGEIALDVDRRAPGQPLVVTARDYQVRVVGTIFSVRAPAGGPIEVSVSEGLVHVRGPATDLHLRPGDRWSSATQAAAQATTQPAAQATTQAAAAPAATAAGAGPPAASRDASRRTPGACPEGNRPRARAPVGGAAPPGTGQARRGCTGRQRACTLGAGRPAGRDRRIRRHARPGAGTPRGGRCSRRTNRVAFRHDRHGPCARAPAHPPPSRPAGGPGIPPPPSPPPSAEGEQARYQAAQALAAEGRYGEAADALGRLAAGGGSRAELALYDRGKLLLRHLRDPGQAAEVFADHRRRFPHGSLRPDVDLSLVEALLAGGQLDRAGQQIEHFLAAHPDSERRDEVRLMRAHVARERGDWRRARDDYDGLTAAGGSTAEEALYFTAYCRRRLGDTAGARQTLERYLAGFPRGRYARAAREALGAAP